MDDLLRGEKNVKKENGFVIDNRVLNRSSLGRTGEKHEKKPIPLYGDTDRNTSVKGPLPTLNVERWA